MGEAIFFTLTVRYERDASFRRSKNQITITVRCYTRFG